MEEIKYLKSKKCLNFDQLLRLNILEAMCDTGIENYKF